MAENNNPEPQEAPQQHGRKRPWRKGKRQGQLNPAPSGEQAVVEQTVLQDGPQPEPAPVLDGGSQPGAPVVIDVEQPMQAPVRQFFPVDQRGVELQQKGVDRLAALREQWAAELAGGQRSGADLEQTVDPEGERDDAPVQTVDQKLEALKARIAAERARQQPEPARGATFEDLTTRRDPQRRLLAAQTELRQRFDRLTREGAFKTPADAEFERDRIDVATQVLDYLWQAKPQLQDIVDAGEANTALDRVFAMSFVDWRRTFSFASTYGKDTLMVRKARQLVFDILVGREV